MSLDVSGKLGEAHTDAKAIEAGVLSALDGVIEADSWILKSGKKSRVLALRLPPDITSKEEAAEHYKDFLFGAGFDALVEKYVFSCVADSVGYPEWSAYTVDEVGFKLSKRKEKPRENQLMSLVSSRSGTPVQNLHLVDEPTDVIVDSVNPSKVLDFISSDVVWSA